MGAENLLIAGVGVVGAFVACGVAGVLHHVAHNRETKKAYGGRVHKRKKDADPELIGFDARQHDDDVHGEDRETEAGHEDSGPGVKRRPGDLTIPLASHVDGLRLGQCSTECGGERDGEDQNGDYLRHDTSDVGIHGVESTAEATA